MKQLKYLLTLLFIYGQSFSQECPVDIDFYIPSGTQEINTDFGEELIILPIYSSSEIAPESWVFNIIVWPRINYLQSWYGWKCQQYTFSTTFQYTIYISN